MAAPLKVEFQFDFGSPNAYLAELALPAIEQRTGVKFDYVPVLLGGVYKATGNMSPAESLRGIKNKPEYNALEMQRFAHPIHVGIVSAPDHEAAYCSVLEDLRPTFQDAPQPLGHVVGVFDYGTAGVFR